MALRLFDIRVSALDSDGGSNAWLKLGRTITIASAAESVLKRELRRYLGDEVEGRSFLIAGHRGSGKTTLVQRAVADVTESILTSGSRSSTAVAQRPLLVKLHGPSLFNAQLPEVIKTEKAAKEKPNTKSPNSDGASGPPERDASAEQSRSEPADRTHVALVQLTTALYRALCSELAKSFRIHATSSSKGTDKAAVDLVARRLELAARLRLELDAAPNPEIIRGYYLRMGRLREGMLWPAGAPRGMDQGAREIVAIATAAQAFQVCIGAVTYEQATKSAGENQQKLDGKADANFKGLFDRILGIGAGTAIGAAIKLTGGGGATALAAGALGGILTGLTFSWSSSRSDSRNESA